MSSGCDGACTTLVTLLPVSTSGCHWLREALADPGAAHRAATAAAATRSRIDFTPQVSPYRASPSITRSSESPYTDPELESGHVQKHPSTSQLRARHDARAGSRRRAAVRPQGERHEQ